MTVRILFIDDDRAGREVALYNLREAGYEVASASDGQEGLSLFSPGNFDLVITDFKMPGISGIEVLRQIRSLDPDVPVLVITAFGTMETAVEAMREGACYFIVKPFDREHLLLAVEKIVRRRSLCEEARDLRIPRRNVDRGIVCVFPGGGGSMRLRVGDADGSGPDRKPSEPLAPGGGGMSRRTGKPGNNGSL